ncbi:keratinocyte-associated protein 2-like [Ostrea edulis]|uniref:keratinocyte-associated protein 2-like n=1 Tax=Ostrea edulis TaxID=37623 RepID=UPI0020940D24|nr:keratinocyte-associated protein 2-like [Ostrea edulis]
MAVNSGTSCVLSFTMALTSFAAMQMFKQQLAGSEYMTIVGGLLGSTVFFFILIGVGNLESTLFGSNFQTKLFPEVLFCLAVSMFASALVHRVCVTTCFLFSLVALYYINKISLNKYTAPVSATPVKASQSKKKK